MGKTYSRCGPGPALWPNKLLILKGPICFLEDVSFCVKVLPPVVIFSCFYGGGRGRLSCPALLLKSQVIGLICVPSALNKDDTDYVHRHYLSDSHADEESWNPTQKTADRHK